MTIIASSNTKATVTHVFVRDEISSIEAKQDLESHVVRMSVTPHGGRSMQYSVSNCYDFHEEDVIGILTNFNTMSVETARNVWKQMCGLKIVKKANEDIRILANSIPGIDQSVEHPETGGSEDLMTVVMSLNDGSKDFKPWDRNKIADWLDTLEEQPVFNEKVKPNKKYAHLYFSEQFTRSIHTGEFVKNYRDHF